MAAGREFQAAGPQIAKRRDPYNVTVESVGSSHTYASIQPHIFNTCMTLQ